ncbi:hypothetical protein WKW80_32490 [Variovorax humicola]|uniref:TrbL/VirB6 plasmid conjugal transfer protein n=1 Tax=Variovorax humicola TaxID=1769758 RepID=A0ABU8W9N9_9BURK
MTTSNSSLFLLSIIAMLILAACWIPRINAPAEQNIDAGLKRSLATFATARALGAALSVAQGTQVSVEPGGVGVTFAPGQVLQPLNELVDKFADVMLVASVSFGIQMFLMKMGGHEAVAIATSVAVVLWWAAAVWRGGGTWVARWSRPLLVGMLLVRFAVPLTALANEAVYGAFMAKDYAEVSAKVNDADRKVPSGVSDLPRVKGSIWDILRGWKDILDNVKEGFDYRGILDEAKDLSARIVNLIAIFVLQTIVLPFAFLWMAWRSARMLVGSFAAEVRCR